MTPNSDLWILLFIFGTISVVVFIAYVVLVARRRAWTQVAERANLFFEPGNMFGSGLSVRGVYQGRELTLDSFTRRTGKNSTTYTRIVLLLREPAGLEMTLNTEGLFSRVGKLLGMQDIQTGDEALDQRYIIKGQPQNLVMSVLQSFDLRQRLLEAPSLYIQVKGQQVYYEKRGFDHNENNLIALFDLMTSLAGGVERLTR